MIDIGAKFGYYAVGLARLHPESKVLAFDTDPWARRALHEMASANGVSNLRIESYCDARRLNECLAGAPPAFFLSDSEGFEAELFTHANQATLMHATLLIETHDVFVPGTRAKLESTFAASHHCLRWGNPGARQPTPVPLDFLTEAEWPLAVQEARPPQEWLLLLPRSGPNHHLALSNTG
ncbi:MAG: hypothetical protein FJ404_15805 [Verrucomicrobia bacterium]|nr:hypothetical protein [Verrucomicrobiota bacterium]